eukprot:PhF_6_TR22425/c0_g1_i2/m.31825
MILSEIRAVISGAKPFVTFPACPESLRLRQTDDDDVTHVLYPGSFNPLHEGHIDLARAATRALQKQCNTTTNPNHLMMITFEISCQIVGKGFVPEEDLLKRVKQFEACNEPTWNVAITTCSLFREKCMLFPNHKIIIGVDTMTRILDPKYYKEDGVEKALDGIRGCGCSFVVGGRMMESSGFVQGSAVQGVPPGYNDMFLCLEENDFRKDISSTEIRQRLAQGH